MEETGMRETTRADRWLMNGENVVYLAIAVLLMVGAAALIGSAAWEFVHLWGREGVGEAALLMLDKLLLVLMMVELLYTVRVSLRAHTLIAEPFLIVGLIAGVRRILVITAEAWHMGEAEPKQFEMAMIELALLTVMTVAVVVSIILLRKHRVET